MDLAKSWLWFLETVLVEIAFWNSCHILVAYWIFIFFEAAEALKMWVGKWLCTSGGVIIGAAVERKKKKFLVATFGVLMIYIYFNLYFYFIYFFLTFHSLLVFVRLKKKKNIRNIIWWENNLCSILHFIFFYFHFSFSYLSSWT